MCSGVQVGGGVQWPMVELGGCDSVAKAEDEEQGMAGAGGQREGAEEAGGGVARQRVEGGAGAGSHLAFRAADNKNALLPRNWIDRGWRGPAGGTRRARHRGLRPGLRSDQAEPPSPLRPPPRLLPFLSPAATA